MQVEVARFMTSLLAGDFKFLRHLVSLMEIGNNFLLNIWLKVQNDIQLNNTIFIKQDISNREGLASEGDWYERCYNSRWYFLDKALL